MKKSLTINYKKTTNSSSTKKTYKIIKASREDLLLSIENACNELDLIKQQNQVLINYQHKCLLKK